MMNDFCMSSAGCEQRTLETLIPGEEIPIHRHENMSETVVCMSGRLEVVIYEEVVSYEREGGNFPQGMDAQDVARRVEYREVQRIPLCSMQSQCRCQIPKGTWHTLVALEPSVVVEEECE